MDKIGRKGSVFVHAQVKRMSTQGWGVKKWQNSVHVVVECPHTNYQNKFAQQTCKWIANSKWSYYTLYKHNVIINTYSIVVGLKKIILDGWTVGEQKLFNRVEIHLWQIGKIVFLLVFYVHKLFSQFEPEFIKIRFFQGQK